MVHTKPVTVEQIRYSMTPMKNNSSDIKKTFPSNKSCAEYKWCITNLLQWNKLDTA